MYRSGRQGNYEEGSMLVDRGTMRKGSVLVTSVAVIRHHDQNQLRGGRVYLTNDSGWIKSVLAGRA